MTRQNIFKMTSNQNLYNDTRHQVWAMIKKIYKLEILLILKIVSIL